MGNVMDMIGSMRHRIKVQALTSTRDNMGGTVDTWADKFTTWASAKFLTVGSDEKYQLGQLTNRTAVQFTIRKKSGVVSAADRVVFDSLIYEVDAVVPTGDYLEFQIIECYQMGEHKTDT
jgi:SPP1 family predicted phage head-tail adaptor